MTQLEEIKLKNASSVKISPGLLRESLIQIMIHSIEQTAHRLHAKNTPASERSKLTFSLSYQVTVLNGLLKEVKPVEDDMDEWLASIQKQAKKEFKQIISRGVKKW